MIAGIASFYPQKLSEELHKILAHDIYCQIDVTINNLPTQRCEQSNVNASSTLLPKSNSCKISDLERDLALINKAPISTTTTVIEDFPLGRFMRFLKFIKLDKLLSRVTDKRDPKKTIYKIEVILHWVLTVFFSM